MTTQKTSNTSTAINTIVVTGNLGAEPTVRTNKNGKPFVIVSLATHTVKKNNNTDQDTSPDWHSVFFNGTEAKRAENILGKGDYVCVEGRLQYSKRTDAQTGFTYKQAFISAVNFKLIAKASKDEAARGSDVVKASQVVTANCVSGA